MRRLATLTLLLWPAVALAQPLAPAVEAYAHEYKAFLAHAKTERTTVREVLALAREAGFEELHHPRWEAGHRYVAVNRGQALALVVAGQRPLTEGIRLIGAHIDSPRIDLKPKPVYARHGYALLQTNYHGGIKRYQWVNRPLALLGLIARQDGSTVEVTLGNGFAGPTLMIPDMAPHVDREYRERKQKDVIKGEELDPILAGPFGQRVSAQALELLRERYGVAAEDLISAELSLVPAAPPVDVGLGGRLIGAYGHDDRSSAYAAVRALLDLERPQHTCVAYLVDNEETGSINNTGARSAWLRDVVGALLAAEQQGPQPDSEVHVRQVLRSSLALSADSTSGINPVFPGPSERSNAAALGGGVVLKLYGRGMNPSPQVLAHMRRLFATAEVRWQTHVYKVDVAGGGTIARFLTDLNMDVVDVGVALLSAHSPCELADKQDLFDLYRFSRAFFQSR